MSTKTHPAPKLVTVKLWGAQENEKVNNRLQSLKIEPMKVPELKAMVDIKLDGNADGYAELVAEARKEVRASIEEGVKILEKRLPKIAVTAKKRVVEAIENKRDEMPTKKLEKYSKDLMDKEAEYPNALLKLFIKDIKKNANAAVETARKKVAKRKSDIKNMKIVVTLSVVFLGVLSVPVTGAAIIAIVAGTTVAIVASGGAVLPIIVAVVGGTVLAVEAIATGVIVFVIAASKAGKNADIALKELKKSMKAVNEHTLKLGLLELQEDKSKKDELKVLMKSLAPAYKKLEFRVKAYETHIFKAIAAGSKANKQFDELITRSEKLDKEFKAAISKNKDAAKDEDVKAMLKSKDLMERAARACLDLNEKHLKTLDEYAAMIKKINDIVGDYKKDTPPGLQKANEILAVMGAIAPGFDQLSKLAAGLGKSSASLKKSIKKVT